MCRARPAGIVISDAVIEVSLWMSDPAVPVEVGVSSHQVVH